MKPFYSTTIPPLFLSLPPSLSYILSLRYIPFFFNVILLILLKPILFTRSLSICLFLWENIGNFSDFTIYFSFLPVRFDEAVTFTLSTLSRLNLKTLCPKNSFSGILVTKWWPRRLPYNSKAFLRTFFHVFTTRFLSVSVLSTV